MANKCEICNKTKRNVKLRPTDRLECTECFENSRPGTIVREDNEEIDTNDIRLGDNMRELSVLNKKIDDYQATNAELITRMSELEKDVESKGKKIVNMEKRLASLEEKLHKSNGERQDYRGQMTELQSKIEEYEQYSRRDNLIISGLKVTQSFSGALKSQPNTGVAAEQISQSDLDESDSSGRDHSIMTKNIISFAKNQLNVDIGEQDLVAVHPLPKRNARETALCIVRFANRDARKKVVQSRKKLKGTNIFINDHLTPKNATLFKLAREMRKRNEIQSCWTMDCKIFIKINDRKIWIKTTDDLKNAVGKV